jgi:acetate kinase
MRVLTLNPGSSSMKVSLVDDALLANLERLASLAPNHQPLSVTREVRRLLPAVPVIACFDTATATASTRAWGSPRSKAR